MILKYTLHVLVYSAIETELSHLLQKIDLYLVDKLILLVPGLISFYFCTVKQ